MGAEQFPPGLRPVKAVEWGDIEDESVLTG